MNGSKALVQTASCVVLAAALNWTHMKFVGVWWRIGMKTIVFLDDERNPEDVTWMTAYRNAEVNWIVVRNYSQFTALVKSLSKDQLEQYQWSFDHDLQDFVDGREYTGKHCLRYLLDVCTHKGAIYPAVYFHTQNPIGRENMAGMYEAYVIYRLLYVR